MVCSTPELLAKVMNYLHRVLYRNNYPDLFLKKNTRPHVDQPIIQETTKEVLYYLLFAETKQLFTFIKDKLLLTSY